jgi:hypothetical protein
MAYQRRRIPVLPESPIVLPIAGLISRSYPVGRLSFSRAFQGEVFSVIISSENPLPDNIMANLVTTINSNGNTTWNTIPFTTRNERMLECRVTPKQPGLHSFRAEFSLDKGVTWIRDSVPDAWVLIDPPQVDGLRLYTIIPNISGTVEDWKSDLKRIRKMGFNAVHLLPITALDTSQSPYAANDLFQIDKSYLAEGSEKDGLSQLEEYIQEARRLNIRLCFDVVLNHVGVNSKMVTRAPDWIVPDHNQPDGFRRAGYWSEHGWRTWNDLVLINYEHPSELIRTEIWAYMTDYALFWAKYANDTGGFVRFDNLHSSDPEFVQTLTSALHTTFPEVGILAEFFTDETTLLHTGTQWGLNLNLATPWNYKFVPQLRDYLTYIHRVSKHIRYFMPVTTHDSGTPAQEFATVDSTVPRYVAAALFGTGATGITQGVEYGLKEQICFIGRQPKQLFPSEIRFEKFIWQVNTILVDYPAFRRGDNLSFVDNGHQAVIAAFRRDTGTEVFGFLVVCNFDMHLPQQIVVDLSSFLGSEGPFTCTDLLSGERQIFPLSRQELILAPCTAQVLKYYRGNVK